MASSNANPTGVTIDRAVGRGVTYATISGRIGIEEANELQRRFEEVFKAGRPWVVISMKDVDFICSAGMGTLLSAVGEARKGGGEVIFTDVSPKVRTIFEFLDIWDYITTAADKEAALEMVTAGKRMQTRQTAAVLSPSFIADDLKTKLNAGIKLSKEGKLKDALAYFNAVIKSDRDHVGALTWKANILERLGQFGEARRLYKRVVEIGRGDRQLLFYARDRLEKLNRKLQLAADRDRVFEQLKISTRGLTERSAAATAFLAPERTLGENRPPFLRCCRTWDAGALFGAEDSGRIFSRGGGYFIWLGGRGIVVDPGKNFVARFAEAGHRLMDIDAIIVTSIAWDHGADLELILEALARYNRAGKGPVKRVEVYVNGGVYKKNYSWLSAQKTVVSKLTVLYPGHAYRLGTAALDVKTADVPEDRTDDVLGLLFTAGTATFGYVADAPSADADVLAAQYRGARGGILLVHVGVVGEGESTDGVGESLGLEAVGRLLAEVRPSTALLNKLLNVSDPVAVSAAVSRATNVRCIPVDAGFTIDLETAEVATEAGLAPASEVEVSIGDNGRLKYYMSGA